MKVIGKEDLHKSADVTSRSEPVQQSLMRQFALGTSLRASSTCHTDAESVPASCSSLCTARQAQHSSAAASFDQSGGLCSSSASESYHKPEVIMPLILF